MKISSRSSRFAKAAAFAALFAASPIFSFGQNPSATAVASTPVISDGLSPSFRAVVSHLELGGCFFEYSESSSAATIAGFLDELLKGTSSLDADLFPQGFSFKNIADAFGLDSVVASGTSSRMRLDDTYHSRRFSYTPNGRKGIYTLLGGAPQRLMMLDFAPKDTDLAFEFPLSLKTFTKDALPTLLKLAPAVDRAKLDAELDELMPDTGQSLRQAMEKTDFRVGMFVRIDPSKPIKVDPSVPDIAQFDAVLVIERAGWLAERMLPKLMEQSLDANSPIELKRDGDIISGRMKGEKSDPLKDRIAFQADLKADRLVVGTTPEVLATALASKGQLATDAAFSDAWRNMPTDGNFAAYVAPRFLTRIGNLATEAMKPDGKVDSQNKEVVGKLIDLLKPHMRRGHAIVIANQPDGIAMTWNTTVHYGSISAMPLYSIPTLAGFAMPVFQFAAQKVRETGELSKLRKLSAAVKEYIATNGKRPASLSDLKRAGLIDNNSLLEYNDTTKGVSKAWIYRDTLIGASTENAPLIVAPLSTNSGMRATAFTDGSVRMVSEAELARLVKPATGK